jgi:acetate kinase
MELRKVPAFAVVQKIKSARKAIKPFLKKKPPPVTVVKLWLPRDKLPLFLPGGDNKNDKPFISTSYRGKDPNSFPNIAIFSALCENSVKKNNNLEDSVVILTLNCGSSSAKYQVYDWENREVLANGVVERVGQEGSFIEHNPKGKESIEKKHPCPTHKEAIELVIDTILHKEYGAISSMSEIKGVGHRMVQGGDRFNKSVIIDDEAIKVFREVQDLAPLHNPANILGIEAARQVLPDVPHCAVMDTAWHQTMPEKAFLYAVPYQWYENNMVRRYGFHGTSFLYIAKRTAAILGKKPSEVNAIICHIGNGASICAVKNGVSVDTSMGLTPLEGLVMGTRSGDIDPALIFHMVRNGGMSMDEVDKALNKQSGILGITGQYIDRRDIQRAAKEGDKRSELAIEIEVYRLRKYIGAYAVALGRVDALVFTAGVGEQAPAIRRRVVADLDILGIKADLEKNDLSGSRNAETDITAGGSATKVLVIPTDEELVMTEDTFALMNDTYDVHTKFTYSFQNPDYVNKGRMERTRREVEKLPALEKILVKPLS